MSGTITKTMALTKLQKYCAYRERCHSEVRTKLLEIGMRGLELEEVIAQLIDEDFLNEERFARSFARGKFRIKKWGRNKILSEMKRKNISDYCIRKGLEEIEEPEYEKTLCELLEKKWTEKKEKNLFIKRSKIAAYLIRKGYESGLVWEMLKEKG